MAVEKTRLKLSPQTKFALVSTAISVAAGGLMAKYGGDVGDIIFGNQTRGSESNSLANCPPGSVNVESIGETAHGPDLGLAPSGIVCRFGK